MSSKTRSLAGAVDIASETSGGRVGSTYFSPEVARLIEPILRALTDVRAPSIRSQVMELTGTILQLVQLLKGSRYDLSNLPSSAATTLQDGSFLIEWLSPNFRVGFVVEEDPKEAIWYLITKGESSDLNSSGSLASPDSRAALSGLVSFVASNS